MLEKLVLKGRRTLELSQLRVMLTLVVTFLVTGLACLPLEKDDSASYVILVMALVLCVILALAVSIAIFFKARREKDDFLE